MNAFDKGLKTLLGASGASDPSDTGPANAVTIASGTIAGVSGNNFATSDVRTAMKLSAVSRCVDILSDSIGKLPVCIINRNTKMKIEDHYLNRLLRLRPNAWQTPYQFKKMVEVNRLCGGNGYAFIERDRTSGFPSALIPIPFDRMRIDRDSRTGFLYYSFTHPYTDKEYSRVPMSDMIHVKGYSRDGFTGISVLERAADVIGLGSASQEYSLSYYANGGQPAGILSTESDLSGVAEVTNDNGETERINRKDIIRKEWMKRYSGPANAGSIAVLDYGLKYSPISISNKDAQFVEQSELTVQDIARFFGVPLYKLQAGKQSYSSNEQNAVDYVVGTLHPICCEYQQEGTYKLLPDSEIQDGFELNINMLAELKGDTASRGGWYRNMREIGVYSVNDIRNLEDSPDVDGGDERYASLNYVPLTDWKQLSKSRAAGNGGINR